MGRNARQNAADAAVEDFVRRIEALAEAGMEPNEFQEFFKENGNDEERKLARLSRSFYEHKAQGHAAGRPKPGPSVV